MRRNYPMKLGKHFDLIRRSSNFVIYGTSYQTFTKVLEKMYWLKMRRTQRKYSVIAEYKDVKNLNTDMETEEHFFTNEDEAFDWLNEKVMSIERQFEIKLLLKDK